ncbi:MAG: 2Fe-2S iron-sulfur cluster-binding protein [Pseudomonadota bacterium]
MARFLPLVVRHIRRDTRDAVVLTLAPRCGDSDAFEFTQGQYLTFRRMFDGEELRRSYSICAGKDDGVLRVGIKRVDGGAFSTWANEDLAVGDVLEAMPPMGAFHTPIEPDTGKYYLLFAGGSGITPILSIIKTVLVREPMSRMTLVYANRSVNTIMFREELEDLKDTHLGRFNIIHILESEAEDIDLFAGRVNSSKCTALFSSLIDVSTVSNALICGPEPMMLAIAAALKEHGVSEDKIKFELFASGQPGRAKRKTVSRRAHAAGEKVEATVIVDGASQVIEMAREGQSLLDAALVANVDAPFGCKAGVCSTCRALVLDGEVEMEANHALEDYEVRRGYVLTCQSFPVSERVSFSYDR